MTVAHRGDPAPQPRRVALLRGVNLGRQTQLSMPALAELAGGLGWTEVSTVLRSGNLLFLADGSDAEVASALTTAIAATMGMDVAVVIRTGAQLRALIEAHPFGAGDPARTVIACADRELDQASVTRLTALASGSERLLVRGTDIFAAFPDGQASSRLAAGMAKACGEAVVTARNLNTMTRLADALAR